MFQFAPPAAAQGGPPFRTDDPETPGNRQWEINFGFVGDRNPAEGSYETPILDINYGLGDRIQLKYEVPLSIQESRDATSHFVAGLGNSMLGVKWRFFQTRAEVAQPGKPPKGKFSFAMSTYPQFVVDSPKGAIRRGVADPGPQFLLPIETNATLGPIRIAAEAGYWFTPKGTDPALRNAWTRGVIAGHEFKRGTELYFELHDEADIDDLTRESTFGFGGRQPFARDGKALFLGMVGRSLRGVTPTNGQPDWIAYLGIQLRFGRDPKP